MTHLYKIGLNETQLVKALQENIEGRPGYTLAPASIEMNKMKANKQRERKANLATTWEDQNQHLKLRECTHTVWKFKATTRSVSLWLLWFL